jgi:hypothetical protein
MRVFLHTYDDPKATPNKVDKDFARIPVPGEYIMLDDEPRIYEVRLVIHTPKHDNQDAEVWAITVDEDTSAGLWSKVLEPNTD